MNRKWYQSKNAKIAFATTILGALITGLFGLYSGDKQAPTTINQYSTSSLSTNDHPSSTRETKGSDLTGAGAVGKPDSAQQLPGNQLKSDRKPKPTPLLVPPPESEPATYYQIKVHVSSRMKDAAFFVDNEPAQIIEDLTTVKVVRVREKDSNHTISAKKDSIFCSKQAFIRQNNVVVTLCP